MLTINSSIFLLFRKVNLPWPVLSSSVNFSCTFDLFIAVQFGSVFRVHINLGVPYLFLHSDFPYCIWSKLSSLYHRRTWPGKPIYCFLLFFIYCFTIVLMQICLLYVLHHFHMRNSVHPSFFPSFFYITAAQMHLFVPQTVIQLTLPYFGTEKTTVENRNDVRT